MKCVILAAGEGKRMMPLTAKTPKPLLKVGGIALIDYVLESLPLEIDEVIIVVKYLGSKIKKHLKDYKYTYAKMKIRYVEGSDKGNAYSFLNTKKYLKNERFLLVYGDEIPNYDNVKRCLEKDLSILTFDGGTYDGVMVLNTDIFEYEPIDGDFVTLVEEFAVKHTVSFVEAKDFVGSINTPDDIVRVEKEFDKLFYRQEYG